MSQALFDLSDRTALVTGSSRGLGRAIAEGLAKAGARVIVNGADPARVEAAVAEMHAAGSTLMASRSTSSSIMPAFKCASR